MTTVVSGGGINMSDPNDKNIKRVKVSKQRQISIPKSFYDSLDIRDEAFIELTENSIIIRPAANESTDYSEHILKDLIEQGYTGEELILKFKAIKSEIPQAINRMVEETRKEPIITGNLDEYLDSLEDEEDNE